MATLLGASWRTGIFGILLILLSIVLFYLGRPVEAVTAFTTGIAFLNARDSSVTSAEQARTPGLMTKAPDLTVSEKIAPTVNQVVDAKIKELVTPQIEALDKQKADK